MTPDLARDIRLARRYIAGACIVELARMEHVSPDTMRERLVATGLVTIRGPGGKGRW